MGKDIQFRFVPTMRCNLGCEYCFLPISRGDEPTMFDQKTPADWVRAMKRFQDYDVEFYMWGGEPFCIDGTFELVKGLVEYEFVKWARIDSNLTYTRKILTRCPSNKVRLLCSWHTHVFGFDQYWKNMKSLKEQGMVGMANFVASDANLRYLADHDLTLDELIARFAEIDIFFNVAGDFAKADVPGYKDFITKYMTEEDWLQINGRVTSKGAPCSSGEMFFNVELDGTLTTCGRQRSSLFSRGKKPEIVGNFFTGELSRKAKVKCPEEFCKSIIAYPHRLDNDMNPLRHLDGYIARNTAHRMSTGVA